MFIIHGAYHWWPKHVGFRHDFCLTCDAPRRSIQVRTFDAGHIFWIPVLPVGFWKHWYCTKCGKDPHASPRTRPIFKWVGFLLLVLVSIAFWIEPVGPTDVEVSWLFRIAAPAGAVLVLISLLSAPREPSLKQRLADIPPADDTTCPFCATPMIAGPRRSCPACGVLRY